MPITINSLQNQIADQVVSHSRKALMDRQFHREIARYSNQHRQPAGSGKGGQFAPGSASVTSDVFNKEPGTDFRAKALAWAARELAGKEYVNADSGKKIAIPMRSLKKTLSHLPDNKPALALGVLPILLESAKHEKSQPSRDLDKNIKAWHTFVADLTIDGKPHATRLKVREDNNGHLYYDQHVTEKNDPPYKLGSTGETPFGTPAGGSSTSIDDDSSKGKEKHSRSEFAGQILREVQRYAQSSFARREVARYAFDPNEKRDATGRWTVSGKKLINPDGEVHETFKYERTAKGNADHFNSQMEKGHLVWEGKKATASVSAATAMPLESFASEIQKLADVAPQHEKFYDNKAFIGPLWKASQARSDFPKMTLDEFKKKLVQANQSQLIHLSRADQVADMDRNLVDESETNHLNAQFHFVRTDQSGSSGKSRYSRETLGRITIEVARYSAAHWVTLEPSGTHVEIDGSGNVTKGPDITRKSKSDSTPAAATPAAPDWFRHGQKPDPKSHFGKVHSKLDEAMEASKPTATSGPSESKADQARRELNAAKMSGDPEQLKAVTKAVQEALAQSLGLKSVPASKTQEFEDRLRGGIGRYSKQGGKSGSDTGWITIGAHKGEDGKKHGGTPVKISGGKITAGPASLKGETMDELHDKSRHHVRSAKAAHAESEGKSGRDYSPSQSRSLGSVNRVAMHQAAKEAARGTGIPVHHIMQTMPDVHEHLKDSILSREAAKADLRKNIGMDAGDLARHENKYGDHSTVHNWDTAARDIAERYPDLGFDPDDTDTPGKVWEMLREGKRKHLALHDREVAETAAEWLHGTGNRKTSADREPGSDDDWSEPEHEQSSHPSGKRAKEVIPFSRGASEQIQREVVRYAKASAAGQKDLFSGEKRSEPVKQGRIDWDESKVKRNADGEFATKEGGDATADHTEPNKSKKLTREEFRQQYNEHFERLMSYSPNEVGSHVFAEKMAELEDEYPEFAKEMDDESNQDPVSQETPEEFAPGVPGMQTSLFDEDANGQKQLFNYVSPKKGDQKPAKEPTAPSTLEAIEDQQQKEKIEPIAGQKYLLDEPPAVQRILNVKTTRIDKELEFPIPDSESNAETDGEPAALHPPGVSMQDIPLSLGYAAHQGTSHVPDQRAQYEQRSYLEHMQDVWNSLSKIADTPERKEILANEWERYRDGYLAKTKAHLHAKSRVMSSMITGPARFPVARNQKANDTADKRREELLEFDRRAQSAIIKKLRPDVQPIKIGDTGAADAIGTKLKRHEDAQEKMKEANKIIRSGKDVNGRLLALGLTEDSVANILKPDYMGRIGFPDYRIKNNGAEIRRLKERLEQQKKRETEELHVESGDRPASFPFEGGAVHLDYDDNRIRIKHDEKPPREMIEKLKSNGFRWSPSNGAWQRQLTESAKQAATNLVGVQIRGAIKQ